MRKLTHEEIVKRQMGKRNASPLPMTVILNNIRSLYNVGSIFRTADGAGVEKIWLCGITGYPPNPQISKTALGADERVPWEYHAHVVGLVGELKARGYQIILLEQTDQSISYEHFDPETPVCLIIGNEITGTSDLILPYCDAAVEIEMAGLKNSLNVAVAFGIVVYHFRHCFKKKGICWPHP